MPQEFKKYIPSEAEIEEAEKMMTPSMHLQSAKNYRLKNKKSDLETQPAIINESILKKTIEVTLIFNKDLETQTKTLIEKIKKAGFYKPDALYRGADIQELFHNHGTEKDFFASTEEEMNDVIEETDTAVRYTWDQETPILIILDPSKLFLERFQTNLYHLRPGVKFEDAILGVVKINFQHPESSYF